MQMTDFKAMLEADASAVFLNPGEFGEQHTLAGRPVTLILEETSGFDSTANDSFIPPAADPELPRRVQVIHCHTADLPPDAEQGGSVEFDGETHIIITRHDGLGGMTRLEITRRGYRWA